MDETLYAHVRALQRGGARAVRASKALSNLLFESDDNVALIVAAGAIAPLVALVRNGSDGGKEQAACALGNLSSAGDAYDAMIAEAGAIEPLVELERNGSDDAKESATRALDTLAFNSDFEAAVAAARRRVAPAVEPSTEPPNLTTCIACEDAARSVVFLPCAHACFCESCAATHRATSARCPICRTAITGFVPFRLA